MDNKTEYNFGEMYQMLDYIKKRHLQLEYLELLAEVVPIAEKTNDILNNSRKMTVEKISGIITDVATELTALVPQEQIDELDFVDYDEYTAHGYGSAFWDEIDHPHFIQSLFEKLAQVFGLVYKEPAKLRPTTWLLKLYNLKGAELYFGSKLKIEELVSQNDVAPATAYSWNSKRACFIEEWSIRR